MSLLELDTAKLQEQVGTDIIFIQSGCVHGEGHCWPPRGTGPHCRARTDYQGNIKGVVAHMGLHTRNWWGGAKGWRVDQPANSYMLICVLGMLHARFPCLGPSPTSGWVCR